MATRYYHTIMRADGLPIDARMDDYRITTKSTASAVGKGCSIDYPGIVFEVWRTYSDCSGYLLETWRDGARSRV